MKEIVVISGKGGVGKSSIAADLAVWLSMHDKKVGPSDIDTHGPSTRKLLNLEAERVHGQADTIEPVLCSGVGAFKCVFEPLLRPDKQMQSGENICDH